MRPLVLLVIVLLPISCGEKPATAQRREAAATQLAQLLTTNGLCKVRLLPPWMGETRETVRTGICTNKLPKITTKDDSHLRFDWFSHHPPVRVPLHECGPITISEDDIGAETAFHSYRAALPSDELITTAERLSRLRDLLGSAGAPGLDSFTAGDLTHGSSSWSLFTMKGEKTIETLRVFSLIKQRDGDSDWRIEGLRVTRGTASPWQE